MLKDITIGQYIAGNSPIHRADARMKLILSILLIVVLFLLNTPLSYGIFVCFTIMMVLLSRVPLPYFLKGIKPMLFIILFTVILNLFFTPGNTVFSFKALILNIKITDRGIFMSITMLLRLTLLVVITSLLTLTTTPMQLTDAIEQLLKPFGKIKVPYHEIAMMMSLALRFVPTLLEETDKIMSAQKARGADMESGNIIKRVKALMPVLIPLFVSAFRRAYEIATAMECRCYRGGSGRTKMKSIHMSKRDAFSFIALAAVICGVILCNIFIPAVI